LLKFDEVQISDIATLNRGINQSQQTLTDKTTGGLNVHAKADAHLLTDTSAYVKESKDNLTNFGTNATLATGRAGNSLTDLGGSALAALQGKDGLKVYQNKTADLQSIENIQVQKPKISVAGKTYDVVSVLNNKASVPKEVYDQSLAVLGGYIQRGRGHDVATVGSKSYDGDQISDNSKIATKTGVNKTDSVAITNLDTAQVGYNAEYANQGNVDQTMKAMGKEMSRVDEILTNQTHGKETTKTDEQIAQANANHIQNAWSTENGFQGNSVGNAAQEAAVVSPVFIAGVSHGGNYGFDQAYLSRNSEDVAGWDNVEALAIDELVISDKKKNWNNFGPRWIDPNTKQYSKVYKEGFIRRNGDHQGDDLAATKGSPIFAAGEGVVAVSGIVSGYGNTVVIKHIDSSSGKPFWTLYGHMNTTPLVSAGDSISEGEKLGSVGNTGAKSQGPHLHFGINMGQAPFDKSGWINPMGVNIGNYDTLKTTPAYKGAASQ